MANIGQTLFRFTGALMLAAGATAIDHPRVADRPVARRMVADAAVVIATRDIPEGTSIVRGAVALLKWPAHAMPRGAYTSVESVVGTVAKSAIFRGEPLVSGRLGQGGSPRLEHHITPGKRAFAIRVNDLSDVAGMVIPNSRVDILITMNEAARGRRQRRSLIFMSNVRVLAIGVSLQRDADGQLINSHVATIEVSPQEAENLAIAASQGVLSLALRGYGDPVPPTTNSAVALPAVEYFPPRRNPEVVNAAPAPVVVAPPPPPKPDTARVRIFRGSSQARTLFDSTRRQP